MYLILHIDSFNNDNYYVNNEDLFVRYYLDYAICINFANNYVMNQY